MGPNRPGRPRTSQIRAPLAGGRGNHSGDLRKRRVVDRIAALPPCFQTALQRANATNAVISQDERRTGTRGFVWSSAVEDDFAVAGQPVVLFL
jgi:hypothetical protein